MNSELVMENNSTNNIDGRSIVVISDEEQQSTSTGSDSSSSPSSSEDEEGFTSTSSSSEDEMGFGLPPPKKRPMGSHGNLDLATKAEIIKWHKRGWNFSEIGRETGVYRATVRRWVQRYKEEGSLQHRQRCGRPRLIGPSQRDAIMEDFEKNKLQPTHNYAGLLKASAQTVRRVLAREGLQYDRSIVKGKRRRRRKSKMRDEVKRSKWTRIKSDVAAPSSYTAMSEKEEQEIKRNLCSKSSDNEKPTNDKSNQVQIKSDAAAKLEKIKCEPPDDPQGIGDVKEDKDDGESIEQIIMKCEVTEEELVPSDVAACKSNSSSSHVNAKIKEIKCEPPDSNHGRTDV